MNKKTKRKEATVKIQKFKEKLQKEKKLTRRVGGLFGVVLGLIMAFSFFPVNKANAGEMDISNNYFALIAGDPALVNYDLSSHGWYSLGINNNGASNHSPACSTHSFRGDGISDLNLTVPRFHPKGSNRYPGKWGNSAYTLMDDSKGNKNIFKMLEVADKSGDAGKKLRGTSKFYSGDKDWQRFEFQFLEYCGEHVFSFPSSIDCLQVGGEVWKVKMRSEKTGNYIAADGVNHGASMHVANPGDNIELYMVIWMSSL